MTKKHFDALAAALHAVMPLQYGPHDGARWRQWHEDCGAVADACARFNVKFDRARFLGACEGGA